MITEIFNRNQWFCWYGILPLSLEFTFRMKNLGIRLEDDYVIQESGEPINLMKDIPS